MKGLAFSSVLWYNGLTMMEEVVCDFRAKRRREFPLCGNRTTSHSPSLEGNDNNYENNSIPRYEIRYGVILLYLELCWINIACGGCQKLRL